MEADLSREQRNHRLAQKVIDTLALSGNCAQTSFVVLEQEFDLDAADIRKALTPFPGIALRGETCGAVVGCLMALGLIFGREELSDWSGFISSLRPARRFCRSFEEQHGSTACASILESKLGRGFNLADPAESMEYLAAGGQQKCGEVVASAVQTAAELIRAKA